jgi:hypothetical protein
MGVFMKEDKHFPFLDKEFDILGLEIFDIAVVLVVALTVGVFTFLFLPFFKFIGLIFIPVITMVGLGIIKKKKQGKERGWVNRQFLKKSRRFKRIY